MDIKIKGILLGLFSLGGLITSASAVLSWNPSITILPSPSILSLQYLANNNFTLTLYYYDQDFANMQVQAYNYLYIYAGNGQLLYENIEPLTLSFNQNGTGETYITVNGPYLYDELLLYQYSPLIINDTLCLIYNQYMLCSNTTQEVQLTNVGQSTIFEFTNSPGEVYTPQYLEEYGLQLNLFSSFGTAQENISQAELTLTLENSKGDVIYTISEPVSLDKGINEFSLYIPPYVFVNQYGEIFAYATLSGVFTDGQLINAQANYTFYIGSPQTPLQIISVSPNFDLLNNLQPQQVYQVSALLYNQLPQPVSTELLVYVYDQYGDLVYQNSASQTISSYQQTTLTVPLSLMYLSPGLYTINVQILEEVQGQEQYSVIYNKTYQVTLGQLEINPINVISVMPTQFNIVPNSYATFILTLQNAEPYQVSVQPYVISQQLGIFQQLSTITLQPNQVEQIPLTIYIPANLSLGYYPITLEFYYNGAFEQYQFNVFVNGTYIPPEYYQVTSTLEAPSVLISGENNSATLLLESNTTALYNVSVILSSNNAKIYPEQIYTLIGGTSYVESYPIKIYPTTSGNITIDMEIYNEQNGELLYNETETLYAQSSSIPISEYILYALIIAIAAVLVGVVLYDVLEERRRKNKRNKKKEEEPEE